MSLFILLSAFYAPPPNAKDTVVKYDSSLVKTVFPDKAKEEKLFSDPALQHQKEKIKDSGSINDLIDWLADRLFGGASPDKREFIFNIILWVFCLAGLGVIIWLLTRTEFVTFLRGQHKQSEFSFIDVEEDIKGIDFDNRIAKAYDEKNYRLAIRWQYLKQLNNLNDKNLISYQSHKTNIDYGKELAQSNFKEGFLDISRVYDFVWYGEYGVTEEDYAKLSEKFKMFEAQIKAVNV